MTCSSNHASTSAAPRACAPASSPAVALALSRLPGFGWKSVHCIMEAARHAHMPPAHFVCQDAAPLAPWLPASLVQHLVLHRPALSAVSESALRFHCAAGECDVRSAWCPAYPAALRALGHGAPPICTLCGDASLLKAASCSVAGARMASPLAIGAARAIGLATAPSHVLVSGGASGVDTAAHRASVEGGGSTIIVLAQGLKTYAPPAWCREGLLAGRILLVSFAPEYAPWRTHHAVARNRAIAALGRACAIVEPRRAGGSFQTAEAALALGRPVAVAPCTVTNVGMPGLAARGAQVAPLAAPPGAVADALLALLSAAVTPVAQPPLL